MNSTRCNQPPAASVPAAAQVKKEGKKRDSETNSSAPSFLGRRHFRAADGKVLKGRRPLCRDITYFALASAETAAGDRLRPVRRAFSRARLVAIAFDAAGRVESARRSRSPRFAAGAVARTAFVEVTLTVPGKHDKETVGLTPRSKASTRPSSRSIRHRQGITDEADPARHRLLGDQWDAYNRSTARNRKRQRMSPNV